MVRFISTGVVASEEKPIACYHRDRMAKSMMKIQETYFQAALMSPRLDCHALDNTEKTEGAFF